MSEKKQEVSKEESKEALSIMATSKFKTDFSTLLKTRYPLFYVTTNEEKRFLQFMDHFSRYRGYQVNLWDCFNGLIDLHSMEPVGVASDDIKQPLAILEHIINEGKTYVNNKYFVDKKIQDGTRGTIYILLDYCRYIEEDPDVERRLKSVTNLDGIVSTIITGPSYRATDVLENLMPVLDFPYPNKEEIKNALWQVVNSVRSKITDITKETKSNEENLVNAVSGLTLMEAQTAFAKSVVSHRGWDIPTILEEKRQIISKSGILEFYNNTLSLEDVGGLKNLINWIKDRKNCFSEEAEKYGLQKPRGLLTIGMPGCVLADTKIRIKKILKEGKHKIYTD